MRLILGILAIFAMLAGNAHAQSARITNWTEKSYSEEEAERAFSKSYERYRKSQTEGWQSGPDKGYSLLDFLSGIHCSGRYCDNKRFKYTTDFRVQENKPGVAPDIKIIRAETGSGAVKCPAGSYIAQMWCESGRNTDYCAKLAAACVKPILTSSKPPVCGMEKTISDEGASRLENEVTLMTYQLFDGMECSGKYCDNLKMTSCNIYGTEKDLIPLELTGASWKNVGSMIAGTRETSYTAGLEIASSTGHEVGGSVTASTEVSVTAGVSGSIGVAEVSSETTASAGLAVTAQYAHSWNNSKASSSEVTVAIACDRLGEDAFGTDAHADVYAFSLIAKGKSHSVDANFQAVTDAHYACSYGTSTPPAPVCFPKDCKNEFATNCQKCGGSSISEAWGEEPVKVTANYREEEEILGSFVEFYGWWDWKDGAEQPADTSYLVLYNDNERRENYTLCQDSECVSMGGKYMRKARGAELVLEGVFGQPKSRIVFKSAGGGKVTGSYWHDKSARGEPDGTIELDQL